ncbi:hypothetical protein IWX78_002072 [Mycetocola sp. CAN_C7]
MTYHIAAPTSGSTVSRVSVRGALAVRRPAVVGA